MFYCDLQGHGRLLSINESFKLSGNLRAAQRRSRSTSAQGWNGVRQRAVRRNCDSGTIPPLVIRATASDAPDFSTANILKIRNLSKMALGSRRKFYLLPGELFTAPDVSPGPRSQGRLVLSDSLREPGASPERPAQQFTEYRRLAKYPERREPESSPSPAQTSPGEAAGLSPDGLQT